MMPDTSGKFVGGDPIHPPKGKHNFKESYMRMLYASDDGSIKEWVWNSRDGITPFMIAAKDGETKLSHVEWNRDQYRPDYVPQVGERVFVTFTEEQARPLAVEFVDKYWNDAKYPMSEHPEFADSKESAVEKMIASWIADWGGYSPHVVEVTPAMHAQFRARAEEIHKGYRQLSIP